MLKVSELILKGRIKQSFDDIEVRLNKKIKNKFLFTIVNKSSGRSYTVVIESNEPDIKLSSKVKVYCACRNFKFEHMYVLNKNKTLAEPDEFGIYVDVPPQVTNPNQKIGTCKHIKEALTLYVTNKMKVIDMTKGRL